MSRHACFSVQGEALGGWYLIRHTVNNLKPAFKSASAATQLCIGMLQGPYLLDKNGLDGQFVRG